MKLIRLTQGKYALVDDVDYLYLNNFKWYFNNGYAVRQKQGKKIYMHRVITGSPKLYIDHANGDTLDNRKTNLRLSTNRQNQANSRMQINNTSGFKGVYQSGTRRWRARLFTMGERINGGTYDTKEDAAKAYNRLAVKYFGEFARLNQVQ